MLSMPTIALANTVKYSCIYICIIWLHFYIELNYKYSTHQFSTCQPVFPSFSNQGILWKYHHFQACIIIRLWTLVVWLVQVIYHIKEPNHNLDWHATGRSSWSVHKLILMGIKSYRGVPSIIQIWNCSNVDSSTPLPRHLLLHWMKAELYTIEIMMIDNAIINTSMYKTTMNHGMHKLEY